MFAANAKVFGVFKVNMYVAGHAIFANGKNLEPRSACALGTT
jgi:hypothetical protein